jgi:hypothetical protein
VTANMLSIVPVIFSGNVNEFWALASTQDLFSRQCCGVLGYDTMRLMVGTNVSGISALKMQYVCRRRRYPPTRLNGVIP